MLSFLPDPPLTLLRPDRIYFTGAALGLTRAHQRQVTEPFVPRFSQTRPPNIKLLRLIAAMSEKPKPICTTAKPNLDLQAVSGPLIPGWPITAALSLCKAKSNLLKPSKGDFYFNPSKIGNLHANDANHFTLTPRCKMNFISAQSV
jgi:hypothetical protein